MGLATLSRPLSSRTVRAQGKDPQGTVLLGTAQTAHPDALWGRDCGGLTRNAAPGLPTLATSLDAVDGKAGGRHAHGSVQAPAPPEDPREPG